MREDRGVEPTSARPSTPRSTPLDDVADWLTRHGGLVSFRPGEAPVPTDHLQATGLSLSSQRVRPGDIYAALPGARRHGIAFALAAVEAGAVAVLTDDEGALAVAGAPGHPLEVPLLLVPDPRMVLGPLAAFLNDDPATRMRMIGVTGTQGKTTTTMLAESGLRGSGTVAGVIGTVGTLIDGRPVKTALTTPEAPDLHGLFAAMVEYGVQVCAMEVSSHALVKGRVDGIVFDVAVFLNLGRDHLDFHPTVEDYYQAKASLFTPERARLGLVDIDDEHGRRLAGEAEIEIRTFSITGRADWSVSDVVETPTGSTFRVHPPTGESFAAACPIPGRYNVSNTLAALAAIAEAGLDPAPVAAAIATAAGVPGRLEPVEEGQDFSVLVDYAHKPDAVEAALRTLRPLTGGRLVIVLGAGGDRDHGKRPIMAESAARLADELIVTDDNPRTEDPAAIRAAMLSGVPAEHRDRVREIGDRRRAIEAAITEAGPGDIVVIAGKGHETGQEIGTEIHPFDDREVARAALRLRTAGGDENGGQPGEQEGRG